MIFGSLCFSRSLSPVSSSTTSSGCWLAEEMNICGESRQRDSILGLLLLKDCFVYTVRPCFLRATAWKPPPVQLWIITKHLKWKKNSPLSLAGQTTECGFGAERSWGKEAITATDTLLRFKSCFIYAIVPCNLRFLSVAPTNLQRTSLGFCTNSITTSCMKLQPQPTSLGH